MLQRVECFLFLILNCFQEVIPQWQNAASALMIAFAADYGPDVYGVLIKQLDPGVMPHFFIVKTLGDYAVANRQQLAFL